MSSILNLCDNYVPFYNCLYISCIWFFAFDYYNLATLSIFLNYVLNYAFLNITTDHYQYLQTRMEYLTILVFIFNWVQIDDSVLVDSLMK